MAKPLFFLKHTIFVLLFIFPLSVEAQISPSKTYGNLFVNVQMAPVFKDSKTFVDAIALRSPDEIMKDYEDAKNKHGFNLRKFVLENFKMPSLKNVRFKSDTTATVAEHINRLWSVLTRHADTKNKYSSLIPLPHSYVVPGGRFREIYYWDSYFTMFGLAQAGKVQLMRDMIDNFTYLIKRYGFIPNGNRTYYLSRSQPPFFPLMVRLLAKATHKKKMLVHYLPAIEKEYQFWMRGADTLNKHYNAYHNVVRLGGDAILNRYWDVSSRPRPESFREDSLLAYKSKQKPANLYRNLRAAAESGWDFSSRWFKDRLTLATIQTTKIIPIDLNSLMYEMEMTLAKAWRLKGNPKRAAFYHKRAHRRKKWIQKYCWNKKNLLKPGGVVTTTNNTGQQWDAPNSWAPLQWITYKGLINYGFYTTARVIRKRWIKLNRRVFDDTGKMMEKYNVQDLTKKAGGGEYGLQDGFGWTNGVYVQIKKASGKPTN